MKVDFFRGKQREAVFHIELLGCHARILLTMTTEYNVMFAHSGYTYYICIISCKTKGNFEKGKLRVSALFSISFRLGWLVERRSRIRSVE